jgi:hypothetical protein
VCLVLTFIHVSTPLTPPALIHFKTLDDITYYPSPPQLFKRLIYLQPTAEHHCNQPTRQRQRTQTHSHWPQREMTMNANATHTTPLVSDEESREVSEGMKQQVPVFLRSKCSAEYRMVPNNIDSLAHPVLPCLHLSTVVHRNL